MVRKRHDCFRGDGRIRPRRRLGPESLARWNYRDWRGMPGNGGKPREKIHVRRKSCGEIVEIWLVKQKMTYDLSS